MKSMHIVIRDDEYTEYKKELKKLDGFFREGRAQSTDIIKPIIDKFINATDKKAFIKKLESL